MKNYYLITTAIITIAMCSTQNAIAQNKVKKITYLTYKYTGQVNSKKIPEGKGNLNYKGINIEGVFNANKVDDAIINMGYMGYKGKLYFDESSITLEKGGSLYYNYCISAPKQLQNNTHMQNEVCLTLTNWEMELFNGSNYGDHLYEIYLKNDSIVKPQDFTQRVVSFTDTIKNTVSNYMKTGLTKKRKYWIKPELDPPTYFIPVSLNLTENNNPYGGKVVYVFFYESPFWENVESYKDKQGRTWFFNYNKSLEFSPCYKVIYPDGSYFEEKEGHCNWCVYLPDGNLIVHQEQSNIISGTFVIINNHGSIEEKLKIFGYGSAGDFMKLNSTKKYPILRYGLTQLYDSHISENSEKSQVANHIKKTISSVMSFDDQSSRIIVVKSFMDKKENSSSTYIEPRYILGVFEDGKYEPLH